MSEYSEAVKGYSTAQMVRDIWTRVLPYRGSFFIATAIRALGDIAWLYPAIALAAIVDELAQGAEASLGALVPIFLLWGVAVVVRGLSQSGHRLWGYWVAERVQLDTTVGALRHLIALDMVWHEKEGSGNKIKRVQNAAAGMDRLIRLWFNMLVEILVNFVGILYILSTIDFTLVLITAAFMITYFPLSFFMGRHAALASLEVNKEEENLSGALYEATANVRTVKILSLATGILSRVSRVADLLMDKIFTRIKRYQARNLALHLWGQAFNVGTLIFIAVSIAGGLYELGVFVLFGRFFGQIWESVRELAEFSQEFMASKLALARLNEMLAAEPEIDKRASKQFPDDWKIVRFENVSFSYGGVQALSDINFTIRRGEKIGVVGSSGAGKSTLFKLLLKERGEYDGEIYVDNVLLRDITRESYFERVSAVLQDTEVFNLSLKENITISTSRSNDEAFTKALGTAHVTDFAAQLPQGVDTVIGEKGVKLSGGERQRLGIARAIYKEPEILLMDEATSSLDSESEGIIRDSLSKFFEQVTAVVIAHRLSTIRAMDRIIVIEGGRIVEEGTFAELQARTGRFHELWERQKL